MFSDIGYLLPCCLNDTTQQAQMAADLVVG